MNLMLPVIRPLRPLQCTGKFTWWDGLLQQAITSQQLRDSLVLGAVSVPAQVNLLPSWLLHS